MKIAGHARLAWAVGRKGRNGFVPRRIFWGRLIARMEKREGETIVRVRIETHGERA